LGANASRLARRTAARLTLPNDGGVWLVLRLDSPIEELRVPHLAFSRSPRLALLDVLHVLESAALDENVAGVVLRFTGPVGGMSRALTLRRSIVRLREAGKPVVAWSEGFETESYVAASAATRVAVPESGSVLLVGIRLESLHLKVLLDRLGARPEVVSVGAYKSAGERFTRSGLSPEHREQLEALADGLYQELLAAIASGRGLDRDGAAQRVDGGPYSGPAALEAGLVDDLHYPDEVEAALVELAPGTALSPQDGRPRVLEAGAYFALCANDPGWRPLLRDLPHVAYAVARGTIARGRGARGVGADSFGRMLDGLRRDDAVRAVVLRIDSPGGDAVASDLLWRSAALLRGEKPLIVSMGDVAASGGYFMAAAADAIFAEAGTLTGSIGVIGGKLDLGGLFEKVGVTRDGVERGARAGMLSAGRSFTADERAAYRELLGAMHGTFADRVARGRGLTAEQVAGLATGRVFSGCQAQALGLVDELGGPLEALAEARRRAGLGEQDRYLLELHPRLSPIPSWLSGPGRRASRTLW
jgi:protease-4